MMSWCTAVDLWAGRLTALSGAEAASSGVTRSDWLNSEFGMRVLALVG